MSCSEHLSLKICNVGSSTLSKWNLTSTLFWRKRAQVQGAKSGKRCRWSAKTVLKKPKNSHGFRHCCETANNSVWHHFSSKYPPSVFAELGTDSLTLGDKFMVRNLLNVRESKTSALIQSLWAWTLWCFPEKTSCLVSNSFQLQWSFIWAVSVSFIWQRKLCLISTQVQDHRVKKPSEYLHTAAKPEEMQIYSKRKDEICQI